jgi:hypothetical protein
MGGRRLVPVQHPRAAEKAHQAVERDALLQRPRKSSRPEL